MTAEQVFADALGGVPEPEWRRLAGDRLYSTPGWLAFCGGLAGSTPGAVTAVAEGRRCAVPVAAVAEQRSSAYRWDALLEELGLPAPRGDGVLVGPARGYQSHLLTSDGAPGGAAVQELLGRLREAPAAAAARGLVAAGAPVVALYLDTADVVALRQAGVAALPVLLTADAWFPLPDGGWDGWLAALSARRRSTVRRDLRRFAAAGYTAETVPFADVVDEVAALQASTDRRYGRDASVAAVAASFRAQAAAMGPQSRAVLCRRGGRAVGYCAYRLLGDTLYLRSAGFDYTELTGSAEYFTTVYYEPLRAAAAAGARWVHGGTQALEAKAMRGAVLRPLWLLDLSADSVLEDRRAAVRDRNAATMARLNTSPVVAGAWAVEAELVEGYGLVSARG